MSATSTKYDKILPFHYTNYTIAIANGKAGMIDLKGKPLTEFIYDDLSSEYLDLKEGAWHLYHDCCSISLNGKWGMLDSNGNVVIDFVYNKPIEISYHYENKDVFSLELNGKFAVYNTEWKQLTKFYDKISNVRGGFIYSENNKFGIVDYIGNIKLKAEYDSILHRLHPYKNFLVCKKNGLYGIINTNGDIALECVLDKLGWFSKSGNYISIKKKGCEYWGVLDIYKKTAILNCEFDKIEFCVSKNEEQEFILAEKNSSNALYDMSGKKIV